MNEKVKTKASEVDAERQVNEVSFTRLRNLLCDLRKAQTAGSRKTCPKRTNIISLLRAHCWIFLPLS